MEYRVLLLQNGKQVKVLHKCRTNKTSKERFKQFVSDNKMVQLPRKFLTTDNVIPVQYEICRVKEYEKKDDKKMVRDSIGRLTTPIVLFNKWTVLKWEFFEVEETFYVFGFDPISDRKDFTFILGLLVKGVGDELLTKNIIVLNNKLFIYNEYQFDIVLCKCKADAIRLYNTLLEVSKDNKLRRLLFMGLASDTFTSELYGMMMEHTGWDYRRVTRISTNT